MKAQDADFKTDSHQMVLFVEQEDGAYASKQTGSYMTENYMDDFWNKRRHFEQALQSKVHNNEISPIGYYMTLLEMTPADLAQRVGISTAKAQKHLHPDGFRKMSVELGRRYAEVLGIPVANLFQIIKPPAAPAAIVQTPTGQSTVVVTEYREAGR
jgi:hypothetical protein